MATREEWLTAFEAREGRKPSMEEFSAAKAQDFPIETFSEPESKRAEEEEVISVPSAQDLWLSDFESQEGRKPTLEEFQLAQKRGFSLENNVRDDVDDRAQAESNLLSKEKMPRKNKWIIWSSVGMALFLILAIISLSIFYSKDAQMGRLSEAIKSEDATKLVKVLTVNDKDFKLTSESLAPYISYLKANPDDLQKLSDEILGSQLPEKSSDLIVKESGRYFLFWPHYELELNLVYPEITVKNAGTAVKFNQKSMTTSSDNQKLTVKPLVPGEYNLSAALTLGGQPVSLNRDLKLVRFDNVNFKQEVAVEFKFTTITIRSNSFPDADIYIDQRKVGHLNAGIAVLPQMAYSEGMQIYLKKSFPSTTLESDHVNLTEGQPDITLDFKLYSGNISDYKTIVDNFLTQLYKTYGGLTENSNLAKFFENGSSTKAYNDFVTTHFNKIKNDVGGKFADYRYKYFHDAQITLVDVTNNELVFNVNFTSQQYWKMVTDAEIGYQTFHWSNRQIIIDAGQAKNLLANSENYNPATGYIKIRDFGTETSDPAVYDKNFNWSSLY